MTISLELDDLNAVADFIFKHTGNEAVVEHTLAEGLRPWVEKELDLNLAHPADAASAYRIAVLLAKEIRRGRPS
jgi:hypothetical protein